jgi:hypothetical protein
MVLALVTIEGLSAAEWLALPAPEFDSLVFTDEPIVFRVESAEILGHFRRAGKRLVLELAHIDGGGEGALLAISALAHRIARLRGFAELEWIVHATHCARPNPRLGPILERRGFLVVDVPEKGSVYHRIEPLAETASGPRPDLSTPRR